MIDHEKDSPSTDELTQKLTSYILSDVLLDSSQTELEADDDLLEDFMSVSAIVNYLQPHV